MQRAVGLVVDVAVHDGRGGVQPDFGGGLHRVEPLAGVDFRRTDDLPDFVDEDFGGGAGYGVEAGVFQAAEHLLVGPVGAAAGVVGLFGRHRVDVDAVDGHRPNLFDVRSGVDLVLFGWAVVEVAAIARFE